MSFRNESTRERERDKLLLSVAPAYFDELRRNLLGRGVFGNAAVFRVAVLEGRTAQADDLGRIHIHIRHKQITASNESLEWNRLSSDHQFDTLKLIK